MVNEVNKPPSENAELAERLAASNRHLREMQEEHRQLLQEMEMLRQRAIELTRLNAEQQEREQQELQEQQVRTASSPKEAPQPQVAAPPAPAAPPAQQPLETAVSAVGVPPASAADDDAEDPDSADYIRQKIAEIASLKAQYKRVQSIINTTNMIEEHMAGKTVTPQELEQQQHEQQQPDAAPNAEPQPPATAGAPPSNVEQTPQAAHAANQELLGAMLNMFGDFTTDLRGQAESLRAERDRIRALKEEIMQRKRPS